MPNARLAYMPLMTYPDIAPDESIVAAVALAEALECELHAATFSVEIPPVSSPLGGFLLNIPALIRTTEETSLADCNRLQALIQQQAARIKVQVSSRKLMLGEAGQAAAVQARYFDFALLPWARDRPVLQELAEAMIFESGRPAILVPPSATSAPIRQVAIAWDGSRVAARAVADALAFVTRDVEVMVLSVPDEKSLQGTDIAEALTSSLARRGITAHSRTVPLAEREIAEALQDAAMEAGANLLAMGGFGHTRIRDFILGGATKGVLSDLQMPVLLSH